MEPKPHTYYKHRYGGLYRTQQFPLSTSTVDKSVCVVYEHVWPFETQLWHRPIEEFTDGRFTELTSKEALALMRSATEEEYQEIVTANKKAAKSPKEGDIGRINGKVADFRGGKWRIVQG